MSGYWGNLLNAAIGVPIGFSDQNRANDVIGLGKKYEINQANRQFMFEQGFAKSSDVYSIGSKIARNGMQIPWLLKLKTGDKITDVLSGDAYDIIQNPNPQQTRMEYVEQGLIQRLMGGNNYYNSVIPTIIGMTVPTETYFLHPQLIQIDNEFVGKFNTVKRYVYRIGGKEIKIDPEKITQLRYCNPTMFGINHLYGLSPLVAGYLTLVGLNNNQTASASILEHQGIAGILSNEGDEVLSSDERDEQQELFDKKSAGALLYGKILQSFAKIKYTKLGLDPSQLKIIETKLLKMRDLCNIYDVRSVLFNDMVGTTFNNLDAAERHLWANPVWSNTEAIKIGFEKEVLRKFNAAEFPDGRSKYFIELDRSAIPALQADGLKKAQKAKSISETIIKILTANITINQMVQAMIESLEYTEEKAKQVIADAKKAETNN